MPLIVCRFMNKVDEILLSFMTIEISTKESTLVASDLYFNYIYFMTWTICDIEIKKRISYIV